MNEPIIAQFRLPITEKETVQELMQKGVDWGKTIGAIEELEKIKAEFEDKILLNQTVAIQILDNYIAELKGGAE